jgi:metallo-beta-lactamase family protein
MTEFSVIHHGAHHSVTGSCHELRVGRSGILIDCGQFQGKDSQFQSLDINFPIQQIEVVVITHAHIDHIGRLPWLLAAGYKGPIYCTPATALLIPMLLSDGLALQLGLARHQIQFILQRLNKQIKTVKYGQWWRIGLTREASYLYLRFTPAGHILGSAIVELRLANQQVIVFSGDLGPSNTPLLPDPIPPLRADLLVLESTYGDKLHESVEQRAERLGEIIHRSLQDGGTILIPAFSIGRTQELLFDIERLIYEHNLPSEIPIILDSPMAVEVTRVYRRFKKLWGKEAKQRLDIQRHPLAFEQCITIDSYREHHRLVNRLSQSGEAAIVIAASGMCQGGRIMDYLATLLSDKRTDVIFAGYQAQGTLGRELQSGQNSVVIDGTVVQVNAQIHAMSGYSAHADQADLVKFVEGIKQGEKKIRLVHGEAEVQNVLAERLQILDGVSVI